MQTAIRFATPDDAARLAEIYSYYVDETAVSFEYASPGAEDFAGRIAGTLPRYPYIVCLIGGKIAGYACAHSYRGYDAYRWGAELSVYVDEAFHGRRAGSALYSALISLLKAMGFQTVYGIVASPNPKSERLHKSMGFCSSGVMKRAGFKLGRWHDITNFELEIGGYPSPPAETLPVSALEPAAVAGIFARCSRLITEPPR